MLKIGMHAPISLWSGEPRECSCIQSSHSSCSTLLNLVREVGGGLKRICRLNFLLGVAFSDLIVTAFSLLF